MVLEVDFYYKVVLISYRKFIFKNIFRFIYIRLVFAIIIGKENCIS